MAVETIAELMSMPVMPARPLEGLGRHRRGLEGEVARAALSAHLRAPGWCDPVDRRGEGEIRVVVADNQAGRA